MKKITSLFPDIHGKFALTIVFVVLLAATLNCRSQGVAISAFGSSPDPNAMLDVSASDKGILIPRITGASMNLIPNTSGMLVYVYDIAPGFYYNDGSVWTRILKADDKKWEGTTDIYYSAGKVGIGTASPSVNLDIEGNSATSDGIDINNTGAGDPQLRFQVGGSSKFTLGVDNSDADKFKLGTTSVSNSVRMTIKSTGEVGIGTENPSATFQVNGTVKAFGPWETNFTIGTVYQASTDGFVVAGLVIQPGSPDANALLNGYTDSNSTPSTCRGLACVRKLGGAHINAQESFTMPVRKGDYWRVDYSYYEGLVSWDIDWIPFGTNNP